MKKPLKSYFKFAYRLFLGLLFRRHIQGGKLLRVCGKVRVSRTKNTKLIFNKNNIIHSGVGFFLDAQGATIEIGDNTFINRRTEIICKEKITIGRDCAISWDVTIMDTDHHTINDGKPNTKPTTIGDKVWIGCKATILKGVTIGDGAIIAAGSVVNRDIPSRCLAAGIPAKVRMENVDWTI